jgi:glycosyltransferase involved in cell wall biosynthesis
MNIGFEAKRFFTNYTGLGNYNRFIVEAMSKHAPSNQYFLYTPKKKNNEEVNEIIGRKNIEVVVPEGVYSFLTSAWRTFGINSARATKSLDIFHGLSQELPFNLSPQTKKVVTVHDLIFLRYPKFYNPIDIAIYKAKVKSACERADLIVAISSQTAEDIIDFLKIDSRKIAVVYQGIHPNFKRQISIEEKARVRDKYQLPEKFVLNVGTIEQRKNVKVLIDALALMPETLHLPVVIVGRATAYLDEVMRVAAEKKVSEKISIINNASFYDLPSIYQLAHVFVYPSLFEGFGIPLVEAIEAGVPVITSTGSCFSEAAGPSSLYVNPGNAEELANALIQVLESHSLRQEMIVTSKKFIERFSSAEIAKEILSQYSKL